MIARPADRRQFLAMLMATPMIGSAARASETGPIGDVTFLEGQATAMRKSRQYDLSVGSEVLVRDLVKTGAASFLAMQLGGETTVRLGAQSELLIDEYIAEIRGIFDLSQGAMVFDRPEDAPKAPTTVMTVFGQLGVRGTRFFAGPSNDAFGVFVDRGRLEVNAGGQSVELGEGEGVDLSAAGIASAGVTRWSQQRIDAAFASVGL